MTKKVATKTTGSAKKNKSLNVVYPTCKLKELRLKLGLTQTQVAKACKYQHPNGEMKPICVSALCCAEKGGNIYLAAADALAKYFGVSKCQIWPDSQ